jgi:bifunctional non-homologous end joining protein LigD
VAACCSVLLPASSNPAFRPPQIARRPVPTVHEIKHDGYRLIARRDPVGIRLLTRNSRDLAPRYPFIVEAVNALKVRSCLIDGEAMACDDNGLAVFERLREKPAGRHVFLYAFDLLELDGKDFRRDPIEVRKATLASLLRSCAQGLRLNEHLTHDGEVVFRHACKMGLEGFVSNRLGSIYRSGRSKVGALLTPAMPFAVPSFGGSRPQRTSPVSGEQAAQASINAPASGTSQWHFPSHKGQRDPARSAATSIAPSESRSKIISSLARVVVWLRFRLYS